MKTSTFWSAFIATTIILLSFTAGAQKQIPSAVLELKLAPESDASRFEGNMRVLLRTGRPAAVYSGTYRVRSTGDAESKAREYLTANREMFGLSPADIQSLRLHVVRTNETGSIVRLRQTWQGLAVNNNAEITIHITPDNIVDFVQNGFQYGITMNDITPATDAVSARQQVFSHLRITAPVRDEKTSLMMLRYQNADYLVHRISFNTDEPVGDWEAFVDAKTGALLKVEDVAVYHHAKKNSGGTPFLPTEPVPYKGPLPYKYKFPARITATGNATVFDPDPLSWNRATYGVGWRDSNDLMSPKMLTSLKPVTLRDITFTSGTYRLISPYAVVQDFEAPSKGTFYQASSNFSTDRTADVFEAVMCFYHVDNIMRRLNDTLSLNIWPYQYSGGVRYDPSGLNGADNSHYMSSSGRFAMGEGGVDDAEDQDVIVHELGHGLHDWATDGGLSQVNGLSEGTGDYMSCGYGWTKGNWLISDPQYYWQYSWDGHNEFWAGREYNYTGVYPAGLQGEVHMDGRIWCHANIRNIVSIGRNRSDIVFWRGMMTTNSSTNQNDAANAVYAMALTLGYTNAERMAIRNSYVTAGYTMPAFVALPVKLTSFNAQKAGKQVLVSWTTSMEDKTESFTIERSADGTNFISIGTVAASGNSTVEKNYSFTDGTPLSGKNYYRLKTKDIDGAFSYSAIDIVDFSKKLELEIFPNPVYDVLTIKNAESDVTIYVYDVSGKQVFTQKITANGGPVSVNISSLPNGVYMVKLDTGNQVLQSKIFKK